MDIKTWIRTSRMKAKLTQEQLGERLGVTKGNVSGWENGRHEPSYSQLVSIAQLANAQLPAPPGLVPEIVLHPTRKSSEVPEGYVRLTTLNAIPYMGAEGVPVDFPEVLKFVDIQRDYLVVELGVNPESICLLPVRGDSMSGTIEHNDLVFVDRTVREFDGDGVYVVVWNRGLVVKRLQGLPRGGIRLKSDNPKYDPIDIGPEEAYDVTICGRVVGSWKVRRI